MIQAVSTHSSPLLTGQRPTGNPSGLSTNQPPKSVKFGGPEPKIPWYFWVMWVPLAAYEGLKVLGKKALAAAGLKKADDKK